MLSQRWKCAGLVNIQHNKAGMSEGKKAKIVSRTKKPDRETMKTALGSHRGWNKRQTMEWEMVVVLAQALAVLCVVTGEGGTPPLSGLSGR